MVTRAQVDRLPVLHRAKRVSKQTITGGFTYPLQNSSFEDGTTAEWSTTNSATIAYEGATAYDGHAGKVTHTQASGGILRNIAVIPNCLYQVKAKIYIPAGQNWTTTPRMRISSNYNKLNGFYIPTAITTADAWNEYDFQFDTTYFTNIDFWCHAIESGAGPFDNYWFVDDLEFILLEEPR